MDSPEGNRPLVEDVLHLEEENERSSLTIKQWLKVGKCRRAAEAMSLKGGVQRIRILPARLPDSTPLHLALPLDSNHVHVRKAVAGESLFRLVVVSDAHRLLPLVEVNTEVDFGGALGANGSLGGFRQWHCLG